MEEFNLKIVKDLIELAKEQEVKKLKVSFKEFSVFLDFSENQPSLQGLSLPNFEQTKTQDFKANQKTQPQDQKTVTAPIIGTFYDSPAPDKEAFIKVGDRVKKGDVLCIIESMKLMNEIKSEFDGVVLKILVKSGEAVEYNQPIIILK